MGKPFASSLELRQLGTPSINAAIGSTLLYIKSDAKVYTKTSAGVEAKVAPVDSVAGKTGAVTLDTGDIASGVFATARLGSGTGSSSNWLRGDGVWSSLPVGTLAGLSDTTISGPSSGHVLRYNGSSWVNTMLAQSDITNLVSDLAGKVGISDTQTITGAKTFAQAITAQQISTPSSPSAGNSRVYFKTDGHLYTQQSSGSEAQLRPMHIGDTGPSSPKVGDTWLATGVGAPSVPPNFLGGPNNPNFTAPGMWVQTGLGPTGQDFTFWIEDGT